MKNKKEKTVTETQQLMELSVHELTKGMMAQANDGSYYKIVFVDPIVDPRGNVYEKDTIEALVRFDKGNKHEDEIVTGMIRVMAA